MEIIELLIFCAMLAWADVIRGRAWKIEEKRKKAQKDALEAYVRGIREHTESPAWASEVADWRRRRGLR